MSASYEAHVPESNSDDARRVWDEFEDQQRKDRRRRLRVIFISFIVATAVGLTVLIAL